MVVDLFSDRKIPYSENHELIKEIKELNTEINSAKEYFNIVTEAYEVEAAIFRLLYLEKLYSGLIRQAKLGRMNGIGFFSEII